jgi:hypothetical protein
MRVLVETPTIVRYHLTIEGVHGAGGRGPQPYGRLVFLTYPTYVPGVVVAPHFLDAAVVSIVSVILGSALEAYLGRLVLCVPYEGALLAGMAVMLPLLS